MKKLAFLLSTCAAVGCALLAGCSKTKDAEAQSKTRNESTGVVAAASVAPVELKGKWNVGKKYIQRIEMAQVSEVNLPNLPQAMTQAMKQVESMSRDHAVSVLKELANGGRELQLEILAQKIDSRMGERTILRFDSAQDAAQNAGNPMATVFRKSVGARLRYLTGADGRVEKVEGYKELVARMLGSGQPHMRETFRKLFSENALKQFCDVSRALPGRTVHLGETWPVQLQENAGPVEKLVLNLQCTFKNWEQHDNRECARLEYTGDVSSPQATAAANPSVKVEKGKISAEAWFDPGLGMVVDSTSNQDLTLEITTQGKPVTVRVNQKTNLKLVKTADLAK